MAGYGGRHAQPQVGQVDCRRRYPECHVLEHRQPLERADEPVCRLLVAQRFSCPGHGFSVDVLLSNRVNFAIVDELRVLRPIAIWVVLFPLLPGNVTPGNDHGQILRQLPLGHTASKPIGIGRARLERVFLKPLPVVF